MDAHPLANGMESLNFRCFASFLMARRLRTSRPMLSGILRAPGTTARSRAEVRVDRPQPPQEWRALPLAGQCYVAAVTVVGAAAILLAAPQITDRDAPLLTALAVLSVMTAFAKTTLPVPGSATTLSFCYVIDFTALLVLGPAAATLTSALGVWTQGTFRAGRGGPQYRTWFSIATLALTVRAAWFTYTRLGGAAGVPIVPSALMTLAATAIVYFLSNSILIAGAVAVTTKQRTLKVWGLSYSSIWPGYLFGFSVAVAAAAGITRSMLWLFPFTLAILALTYERLYAYVEGLSESVTDPMTELPNLRYLRRHAPQEIDRASRDGKPLAVLMIDVVDFKSINDTYGHRAGDVALREVARCLQSSVRSYDICARYAGDEFVILLPGCEADEAQDRAAALQRSIADARFEPMAGTTAALEISVGLSVFPNHGATFDELLASADNAMFANKRWAAGRNASRDGRRTAGAARTSHPIVNRGLAPAI
jgi:diguanylate cyclase (GGDEF)-like protein